MLLFANDKNTIRFILLLLSLLTVANSTASAEKNPLWELGIGAAGLYHPHYLGAEQQQGYLFPLPYFTYRGEIIRADRSGIRGFLYNSEKWNLRLSFSGSLPVNSEDNDARENMDDLDLMLEVGPTLQYTISSDAEQIWRFDLPLRAGFLLGDKPFYHQGWTFNPRLYYSVDNGPWTVSATAGPMFSDHRYHGYIYDVGLQDVTANRGYYESRSGYTGSRFSLRLKRHYDRYVFGAGVSYYNLDGAENEDSPLLLQDDYVAVSFTFAWIFKKSAAMVDN
ncbi:MipA/OmpV family protein [Oceanicoccus sp. KOV_DT_Chl]|uniref:MipA/OmpV family protein n=1 Tax=Oceanicoccus sp. KOV_DT_Chl TaxID=1904639 RepID=UPI001358E445|nr:MipA/OmpV family protein [Oceanicoccus sp. KOV_DT_Chl]